MNRKERRAQQQAAARASEQDAQDVPGQDLELEEGDPFVDAEEAARKLAEDDRRQSQLDAFAGALAKKRRTAFDARAASGIEQIWREDEEFYEGIDDANRAEAVHTLVKPRDFNGNGGAMVTSTEQPEGSTVFVNITRAYVDFSAGRAADMLLPLDDANWDLRPTPMPDIIGRIGDATPLGLNNPPPGAPTTIGQAAAAMVEEAKAKTAKAKKRIEDWHEEGQFHAEQRKIIQGAAKVGVSILKGPIPMKSTARAVIKDEETGALTMQKQTKLAPVSKAIDHWNFFPDPSCGENIHHGNYVWERDRITARQLRDLRDTMDADGNPMYLESVIDKCLEEGAQRKYEESQQRYQAPDAEQYEIWYYHGVATAEDLAAAGLEVEAGSVIPVVITMVNDRVIKAARSTLDSGDFPYDVMVWQARENHWAGIGVARQVRTAQRILNGAVRNMMDNAGLGAGPQIIIDKSKVKPLGKGADWSIRPRKLWAMEADSGIAADVTKAMAAIPIDMRTSDLMAIIQFALKTAEDVTGLPMLLQGQQGKASETVGGMAMLTNNSNTPLRAIAKIYDDRITEPHLKRYYEWLLLYSEDDEKGDFIVAARGSSALFERDAQHQAILAMAPLVKDPDFDINPKKWIVEAMKAQRLDPAQFQYTEEEKKQREEQMKNAPPPMDPRIQAAQINAEAGVKKEEIKAEVTKERIRVDTDRDTVYAESERERVQVEGQLRREEMALKRDLLILQLAEKRNMSIEQIKADLAGNSMKLQVQRELAGADGKGPQVATPSNEPPGRAPDGTAYQR